MATRVIGLGFDGSTVRITIGKKEIPCISAAYGDSIDSAFLAYMGSMKQDEQTAGTYKTEPAKIKMTAVQARTNFLPLLPKNGATMVRLPIIIGRTHPDIGSDSDMLVGCRLVKIPGSVENTNKIEEVEFEFTVQQVMWTSRRITVNPLNGILVTGNSAL